MGKLIRTNATVAQGAKGRLVQTGTAQAQAQAGFQTRKSDALTSAIVSTNQKAAQKAESPMFRKQEPVIAPKKQSTLAQKLGQGALQQQSAKNYQSKEALEQHAKDIKTPTAAQRVGSTVKGAAKTYAAGLVNLSGMAAQGQGGTAMSEVNRNQADALTKQIAALKATLSDPTMTAKDIAETREAIANAEKWLTAYSEAGRSGENTGKAVYAAADKLAESGAKDIERAKTGLGSVGRLAVDVGAAGAQMLGDAALGAVTGGSALAPMFMRSAGGSAQEARSEGATHTQQVNYGLASGALSVATEKIANAAAPFRQMFGSGVLDKAIDRAMAKMNGSAAGKAALSFLSEGGEEVLEDLMQPVLKSIYNGKSIGQNYSEVELSDVLHDGLVGGALGLIGSGAEIMQRGNGAWTQQELAGVQEAAGEGNFTPAQSVRAEGVQSAENAAPTEGTASVSVGRATTIKVPYQGETPQQIQQSGMRRISIPDESLQRAKNGISGAQSLETSVPGQGFKSSLKAFYKSRFSPAKGVPVNGVSFAGKQYTVDINSGVPGKVINDANLTPEKLALLDNLSEVVRNGEYVGSGEYVAHSRTKRPVIRYDYFETPVTIGGTDFVAKFDVEVLPGANNYRTHQIVKMDLTPAEASLAGPAPAASSTVSGPLDPTVAQENSGVKGEDMQFDENYAPKNDGVGAASAKMLNSDYDKLQMNSQSFYPEGANAARPVDVPTRDVHGNPISKSASTVMGAKAIPDSMIAEIEQLTADRAFSYRSESDRHAIDRANSTIRSAGWEGALDRYRTAIKRGVVSKDIVVLGQTLLNNAANSGDSKTTAEILSLYSSMSVNTGQAMQAMSILRKMSPENQLYGVQKVVDNLNENVSKRKSRSTGGKNSAKTIPVEEWMDRVGEQLADGLARSAGISETKAQPLTKTILSDLRAFAKQYTETSPSGKNRRSEMDRISDLFHNQEHYQKALDAAKKTVAEKYGENTSVMQALDEWMQSTLDYTEAFTKEVTGQSEIKVSEELIRKFLSQTDQDGRDAVMKEIYQDVANQVPATWKDKWDAWRYLSMLANPRTHVRNIVGNMGFQPVRFAKDRVAGAIEAGLSKAGVKIERTKTAGTAWGKLWGEAWKDYSNVAGILDGSKFADASSEINDMRRIFRMDLFEKARKVNSDALSAEDAIFKRWTYADTLSSYLKANGVTAEQFASGDVDTKLMEKARDYAGREAMRATYNDRNAFSDKVTEVARSFGTLGEAVMPFKRTPANILARGFEFSPLGLGKSIYDGLTQVKSGKKSAAEVIDEAAAGLTGTALLTLGATLAAKGLVTGAGGDDNEDKWRDLLGHQDYALELPDGTSYTLDWLAPSALPFFMGVELMDAVGESGFSADSILTALKSVANPMLDMSMLQSLNDMIESVQYAESRPLPAIVSSAVVSYFTQAVPTLLGQIERTGEDIRMSTYSDRNSKVPKDLQYALGRASARIPGWDYNQIPYIDAWGEEEATGDVFVRAVNNTLNPGYYSKVEADEVEQELSRIAEQTGDTNVYPKRVDKSFTVSGETKNLTGEEYVKYAKTTGQTRKQAVGALIKNNGYKRLSDEEKAEAVQRAYEYANAKGKMSVSDYTPNGFTKAAMSSVLPIDSYILYTINADRDKSGAVDSVESAQTLQELSGLTNSQRGSAWQQKNSTTKEAKNPFTGTLVKAGVSPETSIKVLAKYHELYKASGKAKDKTAEFKQYLRSLGFTPEQMAAAGETFAFYTSIAAKW